MKSTDIISIVTIVAGLVGTGLLPAFGASIDVWAPGWGTKTVAVLSSISLGAGLLIRILNNKTGAPATAIVADAPVVPPATAVVTDSTPVVAQNVTTTTTAPIVAPQKG